jgi:hypothetical protein
MTDKIATVDKAPLAPQGQVLGPAPDYFAKNDRRGFEDTHQSDVLIPRLVLAQALHPQVTDGDPNRIDGLKVGDLFNSVTGQIYGREVHVQLLRKMPLRAMEFHSIDEGGGVIDPNVPIGDPRLAWGTSGDKKADKPKATLFRDFLAVILPQREMIALSFKSSGIKVGKALWGLATMRNKPVFAGRYSITTGVELKPKPHQVYKVQNAGWVSQEDAIIGEEQFESVKMIDATKIDRSGPDDDIDDSMASNLENTDM